MSQENKKFIKDVKLVVERITGVSAKNGQAYDFPIFKLQLPNNVSVPVAPKDRTTAELLYDSLSRED